MENTKRTYKRSIQKEAKKGAYKKDPTSWELGCQLLCSLLHFFHAGSVSVSAVNCFCVIQIGFVFHRRSFKLGFCI